MRDTELLDIICKKYGVRLEQNIVDTLISLIKIHKVNKYINLIYKWRDDFRTINLPEKMKYGIEIECIIPNGEEIHNTTILDEWYGKGDASIYGHASTSWDDIYDGIEITSPILCGDNKNNSSQIHKMYFLLEALKMKTNDTCGGHIHFDANYLDTARAFKNFVEIYANLEPVFYYILNDYNEAPRIGALKYARPFSKKLYEYLLTNTEIQNAQTVEQVKKAMVNFQNSLEHEKNKKDFGLNFFNLRPGEKNTIEFRTGNSNKTSNEKIDAINFCGSVMIVAKKIANLQEKTYEDLTDDEKSLLNIYSIIRSNASTEQKLNAYFHLTDFDIQTVERYKHKYLCSFIKAKDSSFDRCAKEFFSAKGITLDHRYLLAIYKSQSLELDR